MNKTNQVTVEQENDISSTSGVVRLLGGVMRWRRFIATSVIGCTVAALIFAFLVPVEYKATTTIFPAEKAELLGALDGISSLSRSLSPRALAGFGGNPDIERYATILKSGTVVQEVVRKFDLIRVYDITSYPNEMAAKKLLENTEISSETEGALTISVYDRDPQRAADIANYFVECLNKTNSSLQAQNATATRQFIEKRYDKNIQDLAASEDSLKAFQKQHGVITLPQQTEATLKAGAELSAKLALREVELDVFQRTYSPDHPALLEAREEVAALRRKIRDMNKPMETQVGQINLLVPLAQIPDIGATYARLYRSVEIQYKILQYLAPVYEQAKIEEQRQTPSVLTLDKAGPPERKARPKRLLIVLSGMAIGLLGSFGYAFVRDKWAMERDKNSDVFVQASLLRTTIKGDLRALVTRRK